MDPFETPRPFHPALRASTKSLSLTNLISYLFDAVSLAVIWELSRFNEMDYLIVNVPLQFVYNERLAIPDVKTKGKQRRGFVYHSCQGVFSQQRAGFECESVI
jgi:hypothetical protein